MALAATVDTLTGTFGLNVYDADWTLTPPHIAGYNLPDTMQFAIGEIPDTVRTANFVYSPELGVEGEGPVGLPAVFVLSQNHPNPFNPATVIEYDVPRNARVTVAVYNLLGQEVKTLVDEYQNPGYYTVTWNGKNENGSEVPCGVYFYRLSVNDGQWAETRRMVLLK
jgi:hypothetical protein